MPSGIYKRTEYHRNITKHATTLAMNMPNMHKKLSIAQKKRFRKECVWNKGKKLSNKHRKRVCDAIAHKLGFNTYRSYQKSLPKWKLYKTKVRRITEQQSLHTLKNFDKRGRAGTKGAYQVDHKISIYEGFKKGISANIIGCIENLQMLPWKENLLKRDN